MVHNWGKKLSKELLENIEQFKKSQDGVRIVELYKNQSYSLSYGELGPKEENKLHKMAMEEVYYIIKGRGVMTIEEEELVIKKGDIIVIKPNYKQKLKNSGRVKLAFYMIVNPPYDPHKEEILEK
ncbi:MAG: cupin domain-containing protein [Asgard group archaeon]|nr:cupin domain-containing protein [Asgard group archaeon]